MRHLLGVITLSALSMHTVGAKAGAENESIFTLSGFGTLGVVHSNERNADFIARFGPPNGAGANYNWDMNVDSRLAAQLTANFTPQLTGVVQVISEQQYDNSITPLVEWANLKYAFTPDFNIRVGRVVLPTYLVSDFRKVGYADPWVRPPIELYNLVPITNSDGVDVSYRFKVGQASSTVQSSFGRNSILNANGPNGDARRIWSLTNTTEYGAWTFHAAYVQLELTISALDSLFDAYSAPVFGPSGAAVTEKYKPFHSHVEYRGLGASYDPGNWFVMGEFGRQNTHSIFGEKEAWYLTAGYRFGSLTPYATYTRGKTLSNTSDPGIDLASLPPIPPLVGAAAGLNGVLKSMLQSTDQTSFSLGTRWDFAKNADLKVQYDHISLDNNSVGIFRNFLPGFRPGVTANVFSLAVDFVF